MKTTTISLTEDDQQVIRDLKERVRPTEGELSTIALIRKAIRRWKQEGA